MKLKDKVIIITGASMGLGVAILFFAFAPLGYSNHLLSQN